jgi:hypothetical protein
VNSNKFILDKITPKRKVSQARGESQKEIKNSSNKGIKRAKITEKTVNRTETVSEISSRHQIASETYRKVKEVEYRREMIYDKNGMEINYDQDPDEYKRARKRIQNRESAIRARSRKKNYFTELEVRVERLEEENKRLTTVNAALLAEK